MEGMTDSVDVHKPKYTVIGVLTDKLRSNEFNDNEKMQAIQERIAARMTQIIGLLHFIMNKEPDATLHNLIHLLSSETDDPELRRLVCTDAINNPAAMDVARRIEEGFADAGRNVKPKIAKLTDAEAQITALRTLIRYIQHLLTLAKQGERVRYMLKSVTGEHHADRITLRARNAAMDKEVIELFFHIERGLVDVGINVHPEMPALREMFQFYAKKTAPEPEEDYPSF